MNYPPGWYSLAQVTIYGFAVLVFFGLWYYGVPRREIVPEQKKRRDPALLWIGCAVTVWVVVAIWSMCKLWPFSMEAANIIRTFASTLNSAFFLLAYAHLDYAPTWIRPLQGRKTWKRGVIGISLGVALITLILAKIVGSEQSIYKMPDLLLGNLMILLFASAIWVSFRKRKMRFMSWMTVLSLFLIMLVQFIEFFSPSKFLKDLSPDLRWELHVPSMTTFIIVLLTLVISHYKELVEMPLPHDLYLRFTSAEGDRWCIELTISGLFLKKKVCYTYAVYRDLLIFAATRQTQPEDDGWINLTTRRWSYNLITRICKPIGIERPKLFDINHQGSYKLLVARENIDFSDSIKKDEEFRSIFDEFPGVR
jgi:hypothetical protein